MKNEKVDYTGVYIVKIDKLEKEIERLTAESTKWESKFYDEAKKVDRAIEYITYKSILGEKGLELNLCDKQIEKLLNILKGVDKE